MSTVYLGTTHANLVAAMNGETVQATPPAAPAPQPFDEAALRKFDAKPAPRNWTVELSYMVPYYATITVQAVNFKEACETAIADCDWEQGSACWDASTDVGVTQGAQGSDVYLYGGKVKNVNVPLEHLQQIALLEMACAALLDSRQAGGPRRSLRRAIALARMALPHHTVSKGS